MTAQETIAGTCGRCGAALDTKYFDESGFADITPGARLVLARFEVPRRYCGQLDFFAQFTDQWAVNPLRIETPDLEWSLMVNGRGLYPYAGFDRILNPWGFGSFQVALRLDENALLEFAVRVIGPPPAGLPPVTRAGGRIVGRFWYNAACADADHYRS